MRHLAIVLAMSVAWMTGAAAQDAPCGGRDLIDAMPDSEARALRDRVDRVAYAEGLLWRATRGATVIDIFGTYHFRHRETDAHLDRLRPLLEQADKVYLEVSNTDQAAMQRDMGRRPSMVFLTDGPSLIDLLGEADWAAYANAMRARGIPPFMAARFKPLWATMMLGMGPCEMTSGTLRATGIDTLLGEAAAEAGTPSRSLEDYGDLLGLLDSLPMASQLDMIRLTLAWPGDADDLSYTVRERYLAGQSALIWEFSRYLSLKHGGPDADAEFEMMADTFLERRNRNWVDRLMQETQSGERLFLAFGAGHLPGEIGVLRLLEAEGFEITRVPMRR